jgi:S-formylglutathione hydrolase FrmB
VGASSLAPRAPPNRHSASHAAPSAQSRSYPPSTGYTIQLRLTDPGSPAEATLPSRRTVLFGGAGLAAIAFAATGYELVQDGVLPGKYALARLDGACGSAPPPPAGRQPTRHVVTFESAYRHTAVQMVTLLPPDATAVSDLRVTLALHGAGNTAAGLADQVATAMTAAKIATFAVVCPDGGNTYWHKRADGDDPIGMILHEVLPRAAAAGLATRRIGIAGESMGGYGALLLAERFAAADGTRPPLVTSAAARRPAPASAVPAVAAVAAMSPAIFATYADARAADKGSFDSQADFARNNVFASISALRHVPTWVTCGADDPFQPEAALFRARLAALTRHQVPGGIVGGCHDDAFWERNLPAALQFIAGHLG